jgi:hypothetical protein
MTLPREVREVTEINELAGSLGKLACRIARRAERTARGRPIAGATPARRAGRDRVRHLQGSRAQDSPAAGRDRLACWLRLAATLPRSISDSGPRLTIFRHPQAGDSGHPHDSADWTCREAVRLLSLRRRFLRHHEVRHFPFDCVAKPLHSRTTNFLTAAEAFGISGRRGPGQLKPIHSAVLLFSLGRCL